MKKRIASGALSLLLLALTGLAWWQRYAIYDWWRLRGYAPSSEIQQLADATTMQDNARRLFYVYYPALEDKSTFNANCTLSEATIVLGCYVQQRGIHIYNVTDERLDGVHEVTAAHEVLHAAYDRLSKKDRTNVDRMLNAAYDKLQDDRIRKNIDAYRKRDANVVSTELHSILGTEVRDLPADLETYYKRYFSDRSKIVGYSEQYEAAFTERQDKVEAADKQLETMKQDIESQQTELDLQKTALESEKARLDILIAAKKYAEYNNGVGGYNRLVRSYNADAVKLQNLIDEFNTLVKDRNALALEENELLQAIDSRPATISE